MSTPSSQRNRDRWYTLAMTVAAIAFGALVLYKSAYLTRPQGDFGCFARAGWAIQQGGEPLYRVMDDNQWHYNYPPLFAICMTPLADPPRRQTAMTTAGHVMLRLRDHLPSDSPDALVIATAVELDADHLLTTDRRWKSLRGLGLRGRLTVVA